MINIFELRERVINDYKEYIQSFIQIENDRIKQEVLQSILLSNKLWPEPLIQFSPAYQLAGKIGELNISGLHPDVKKLFQGYSLYEHQKQAFEKGLKDESFVVTSGTGSGKSLAYLTVIFNQLLFKSNDLKGVKAIIVYPMNALINSQLEEIKKYHENYLKNYCSPEIISKADLIAEIDKKLEFLKANATKQLPFSYARYTGQDAKEKTRAKPENIILTNYMMLELILTRIEDRNIRKSIEENLEILAFDELHTYKGRKGSDVALLVRRLKSSCNKSKIICIGTSATMSSEEIHESRKKTVSIVASRFFDEKIGEDNVIEETLTTLTGETLDIDLSLLKNTLSTEIDSNLSGQSLKTHPLAIWLEKNVVLTLSGDRFIRAKPKTKTEITALLSNHTGVSQDICELRLNEFLLITGKLNENSLKQSKRESYFAFKLHQFINQTGAVFVTLEDQQVRQISLDAKTRTLPSEGNLPFYQVVFSRMTGHDFLCVSKTATRLNPRLFDSYSNYDDEEDIEDGYFLIQSVDKEEIWNLDRDIESLPDDWLEIYKGTVRVKKHHRNKLPIELNVDNQGKVLDRPSSNSLRGWFVPISSLFDMTSFTVYERQTKQNTIYTSLGVEGRSTSTDVIAYSVVKEMAAINFQAKEQKVLSFTDSRQDTAMQSGHFNDFIKVGVLRSAIYRALTKNHKLDYLQISDKVFDELYFDKNEYLKNADVDEGTHQHKENIRAIKNALEYKIYYDLKRGWRVILPNLEQCALLKIGYKELKEECEKEKWNNNALTGRLSITERYDFFYQLLDYFRKMNASNFPILQLKEIENNKRFFKQTLKNSWLFTEGDGFFNPYFLRINLPQRKKANVYHASIGSRSAVGRFIRNIASEKALQIDRGNYEEIIKEIIEQLARSGFLVKNDQLLDEPLYQLNGTYILWQIGDGATTIADKIKNPSFRTIEQKVNQFFQIFYQTDFKNLKHIKAGEHSGQLKNVDRIEFENKFRNGNLSLLCCSPTMELGIDISDLTVVHMRNVPPDPANYAQRSGRAGRSGQGGLIFTYCSKYSAHDQNYFQNQKEMVAGIVKSPRFDFSSEEQIRSHLLSMYLAETGMSEIENSIASLVEEQDYQRFLQLKSDVLQKLILTEEQKSSLLIRFLKITESIRIENIEIGYWLNEPWIRNIIDHAPELFNRALKRWRDLYILATEQLRNANQILNDPTIPANDSKKLKSKRDSGWAQRQIDLLRCVKTSPGRVNEETEFYPYRYLASEGFLPGYNFSRLPIRIFIPHNDGHYLSRARVQALREFGPRNSIYYMGTKYYSVRMPVSDLSQKLKDVKICKTTGYILVDEEYNRNTCPFDERIELLDDNSRELMHDLVELQESRAEEMGRITCEEEERIGQGYVIKSYFNMRGNLNRMHKNIARLGDQDLLEISYMPAATLYHVNRRWRKSKDQMDGFDIEPNTGVWQKFGAVATQSKGLPTGTPLLKVRPFTTTTADALYMKPLKNLALEDPYKGAITLVYALKRAIETVFEIESNELGADVMGKEEEPNIMIYENAEGSLGVLKRLVTENGLFRKVAAMAYDLCHFNKTEEEQSKFGIASYFDLLSYYNQWYHEHISRLFIKQALLNLMQANYEILHNPEFNSYAEQYQRIHSIIDPNSTTEKKLLDFLYKEGRRLPDHTQLDLCKQCNTIPDFIYDNDIQAAVYCDGVHHDDEAIKRYDEIKRRCMENLGYEVVVWHYKTPLEDLIKQYPHIFKKVKA